MIDIPDIFDHDVLDTAFEFECQALQKKQEQIEALKDKFYEDLSTFHKIILCTFFGFTILLTFLMFTPAINSLPIAFKITFYLLLLTAFFSTYALYSHLYNKSLSVTIKEIEDACNQKIQMHYRYVFDGINVRSFLSIPKGIYFDENNLPIDNVTITNKFGSFTFFITISGNCFHTERGCSSSFIPVHSFRVIGNRKPCSRCFNAKKSVIPDWYLRAKKFVAICERYSLNFDLPRKEDLI